MSDRGVAKSNDIAVLEDRVSSLEAFIDRILPSVMRECPNVLEASAAPTPLQTTEQNTTQKKGWLSKFSSRRKKPK